MTKVDELTLRNLVSHCTQKMHNPFDYDSKDEYLQAVTADAEEIENYVYDIVHRIFEYCLFDCATQIYEDIED